MLGCGERRRSAWISRRLFTCAEAEGGRAGRCSEPRWKRRNCVPARLGGRVARGSPWWRKQTASVCLRPCRAAGALLTLSTVEKCCFMALTATYLRERVHGAGGRRRGARGQNRAAARDSAALDGAWRGTCGRLASPAGLNALSLEHLGKGPFALLGNQAVAVHFSASGRWSRCDRLRGRERAGELRRFSACAGACTVGRGRRASSTLVGRRPGAGTCASMRE